MPANTARVRRQAGRVPAPPAFGHPCRDRLGTGTGQPAQNGRLTRQRLVQLTLRSTLEQAGHLGQEVGPAGRELAQRGCRGVFLICGEHTPLRPEPGFAGELSYEYPVCLRATIGHVFEYRSRSLAVLFAGPPCTVPAVLLAVLFQPLGDQVRVGSGRAVQGRAAPVNLGPLLVAV